MSTGSGVSTYGGKLLIATLVVKKVLERDWLGRAVRASFDGISAADAAVGAGVRDPHAAAGEIGMPLPLVRHGNVARVEF